MKYDVGDEVILIGYYDEEKTHLIPLDELEKLFYEAWEIIVKKTPITIISIDDDNTLFPYEIGMVDDITRNVCDEEIKPAKITNWKARIR